MSKDKRPDGIVRRYGDGSTVMSKFPTQEEADVKNSMEIPKKRREDPSTYPTLKSPPGSVDLRHLSKNLRERIEKLIKESNTPIT